MNNYGREFKNDFNYFKNDALFLQRQLAQLIAKTIIAYTNRHPLEVINFKGIFLYNCKKSVNGRKHDRYNNDNKHKHPATNRHSMDQRFYNHNNWQCDIYAGQFTYQLCHEPDGTGLHQFINDVCYLYGAIHIATATYSNHLRCYPRQIFQKENDLHLGFHLRRNLSIDGDYINARHFQLPNVCSSNLYPGNNPKHLLHSIRQPVSNANH